jgi:hypothetical protein
MIDTQRLFYGFMTLCEPNYLSHEDTKPQRRALSDYCEEYL